MFCPRCATENTDGTKYCRACRENLKVIAQAMKRHLPVVLASKLDEFIERRNERLRRDSIFQYLFGVGFLFFSVWYLASSPWDWVVSAFMFLMACYSFGLGTWYMLAYRRSLALNSKSAKLAPPPKVMYCPRCGESNSNDTKFCRTCGEDLKVVARAMTRRWPAVPANKLDKFIERRDMNEQILNQSILGAVMGAIGMFIGIVKEGQATIVVVVIACLLFIVSIWDIVVYKRSLSSASAAADLPPAADTGELLPNNPLQIAPPAVTESPTKRLDQFAERAKEKL